jgi:hypothetical protein
MAEPVTIKVGQQWQEVDPRGGTLVKRVVHISEPYMHKGTRNRTYEVRDVMLQTGQSQRTTIARSDRFNGKRGGYKLVRDVS